VMAKVLGLVVRIALFCLGAYLTFHAAVLGRLPTHFAWFSPIVVLLEILAICLIWAVIWRLIMRSEPPRKAQFLTQGGPHELSDIMAAAYLGATAGVVLAFLNGQTHTLAYAVLTIAGVVGALGSIAIFSALFKGQVSRQQ